MKLTAPGQELATEARLVLARVARAERRVLAAARADRPLNIAFVSAALNGALADCLAQLRTNGIERPNLEEMTTPAQQQSLLDGRIDLGLLHPPIDIDDLGYRSLGKDPFVAAVPEAWPLARRRSVKFREVICNPMVLFPPEQGPSLMGVIHRLAFEVGQDAIDVAAQAPRVHSQLSMVSCGLGAALVTRSTSNVLQFAGVRYVSISDVADRLFLELAVVGRQELVDLVAGAQPSR